MTTVKVAPSFCYYAMIDGTSAVDSIAFGKQLDARTGSTNWRNLLDLLEPDPADPTRLVDPSHDFLPIYKLKRAGSMAAGDAKGTAVMCPGGLNGEGLDPMWQNYGGGKPMSFANIGSDRAQLLGRHAAAERAAGFISSFMVDPVVEIDGARRHIASGTSSTRGTLFRASLLYLSSHGWLGGFAKGDPLAEHPDALPAAQPGVAYDPRWGYLPFTAYFVIGKLDVQGKAFAGPEWIILAQCSTLSNTTWAAWARVMARSNPQVRGVLGYEEASPAHVPSITIANSFFANLRAKMSFYDAWKAANKGQNWAALVHRDAMGDTLPGWSVRPALAGKEIVDYLGSASRAMKPVPIVDPLPPFGVRVFHENGVSRLEVTPDTLDTETADLLPNEAYTIEVTPPPGGDITQVTVQWIHIRDTFKQFDLDRIFADFRATGSGLKLSLEPPTVLVADYATPQTTKVKLRFIAASAEKLQVSGLEAHHSYLWPRIHLTGTNMPKTRFDVKSRGIGYYG